MSDFLFENFPSISSKQWKQKIQFDLKGLDYNDTLLTSTNEGIRIKPFYHNDSFKSLDFNVPDSKKTDICQNFFVNDVKTANFLAVKALKKGVDSVKFIADKSFDINLLLKGLDDIDIYFQFSFLDEDFLLKLIDHGKKRKIFLNVDLIGNLSKTGNWFFNNKKDHEVLKALLLRSVETVSIIGIDLVNYKNAGANTVQEVAYALAHANEYLNFIFDLNIKKELSLSEIENIIKNIFFSFAQGGNYFFEIAKLRAFQYLWKLLLNEYQIESQAIIMAEPSFRNKTLYDYNANLLRSTTESMSGILGGANVICNHAYDVVFHRKNEFGERIARNQLIILKEESHITNSEATSGSYYIEELTFEIAEKALEIFKEIERSGGFVKQLFDGTIQRKIKENAIKEQQQFDSGEIVLLGTNKYANKEDKMKNELELYPFVKKKNGKTEIQPIIAIRLAEVMEKKRLDK